MTPVTPRGQLKTWKTLPSVSIYASWKTASVGSGFGLQIDRFTFVKDLVDEVRMIRNDVMHFDPEGIGEPEVTKIRKFAEFLRLLEKLRRK